MIRNSTVIIRFNELMKELANDYDIEFIATVPEERIEFTQSVEQMIASYGLSFIPWEKARTESYDLAVSSFLLDPLEQLSCPSLVLLHGPGYTKRVAFRVVGNLRIKTHLSTSSST